MLERWLQRMAWPMTPPLPYSHFHLLFTFIGIPAAVWLAFCLRRLSSNGRIRLLSAIGILLSVSEVYKQFFLYYIVNGQSYDWWYFPFQLCSIPMYLCLLLPFLSKRMQQIFCTFMYSYNLLGAFMVFVEPDGLMHSYWTLTLHSFLWHILLIFIGFFIAFSGMAKPGRKSFVEATLLFLLCCGIATVINVWSHPYGFADMFYITPYYPTSQMVFAQISAAVGILPGNLIYIGSIIVGAGLIHLTCQSINNIKTVGTERT